MRQKSGSAREPAEQVVKDIRRATRRHFSAEEKIRIVLEGARSPNQVRHRLCPRSPWEQDTVISRLMRDAAYAA